MPPHPDVLARIQNHTQPMPYYLAHRAELQAEGVDAPSQVSTIQRLYQRTLDEDINILVILVDFSDHVSRVQPAYFDSLLYGSQVGTLHHFYNEVSYGRLSLLTVNMPSALGWQRAPQTYAYYVNNENGTGTYPNNSQRLAEDVVQLVDPLVDFSQYDNDGDGHVDALFFLHSGPGAEFTGRNSDIWSHSWQMNTSQNVDGVIADRYSIEPEYWQISNDMTCGVFAHEMGHSVFGLPDLYDTGYQSAGIGDWSLMAGGSWNGHNGNSPAAPDAWSRIVMGFVTPTVVSQNMSHVAIPNIEGTPVVYRLWANGGSGNEYFLAENRQQIGTDLHLPYSGMLIYHIDESMRGNDNPWFPGHTTSGHYEVALEQADGQYALERNQNQGDTGDPYPRNNNPAFTNGSIPGSRAWSGNLTRVTVSNISAPADTMTADFAVRTGPGSMILVQLPDTNVTANDTVPVPIRVDSLSGRGVTSFHFEITCDSSVAQFAAPYYDLTGGIVPGSWTMNVTHTPGMISIVASGTAALAGEGTLLSLPLHVLAGDTQGVTSPLTFSSFVFNQDDPPADPGSGSITVSAAHILLQPVLLNFGTVTLGHGQMRTVIIRNSGDASLIVTDVAVPAHYSAAFSGPLTVLAGHWSPVQVTFTPDTARVYTDTIFVTSNAAEGVVSLPMTGLGTTLGVSKSAEALPAQFALAQNFPNPFNPSTVLGFDVPRSTHVTITVYDLLGRAIGTPVNGILEPGHHSLTWSCPACGSGIYLFVMSADGSRYVQKAMLMK